MKDKSLLSVLFILFIIKIASSQNTYNIVLSGENRKQNCRACLKAHNNIPKEVKFSIKRNRENLYFEINDKNWFNELFPTADDGLAIDLVSKGRYNCGLKLVKNGQIRGTLLKPVYASALKKGLKINPDNIYSVWVGKIPDTLMAKDLEFNILFISNNQLCVYNVLYDLDSYGSDLLETGMYLDSLTYNTKQIKAIDNEGYSIKNKTLKFIIPFKKNKAKYLREDIKPIYDSLRLTDFDIKTINIKAYSSIEGIASRNMELKQLRANSIVEALQSFQKSTIKINVTTAENWVEFFNDIKNTAYKNLSSLTKSEVRKRIAGNISRNMEPILKNHRKAVVELELEKKDRFKSETATVLLTKFNSAVAANRIDKAKEIQNSIFEKLKSKEVSIDILQNMQVPKQSQFVKILNKNAAIKYMLDYRQALIVYDELLELEKLAPNDGHIKYNIAVVKMKLWHFKAINIDDTDFLSEISSLRKYGIDKSVILKMMINFRMVIVDEFMRNRDFNSKDKLLSFVNKNYKKVELTDYDYLSLAQFFGHYGSSDLAVKLLEKKARSIDIDEDLLFYYLNLTLVNKVLTKDPDYRTVMLNAININNERFCKLFNNIDYGGITFQLLEDEYLRETYCENCVD